MMLSLLLLQGSRVLKQFFQRGFAVGLRGGDQKESFHFMRGKTLFNAWMRSSLGLPSAPSVGWSQPPSWCSFQA